MSEEREFERFIEYFEEHISQRPLTPDERAQVRRDWESPQTKAMRLAYDPMAWARAKVTFMRQLKERQGTKPTDFDALYHRKAELDVRLGLGDP